MSNREFFKQALGKAAKDTMLRLAFADWLEEQGHQAKAQEQRYRVQLQADPYNPAARTGLGEALLAQGEVQPGKVQLWIGKALRGEVSTDLIFLRGGILTQASTSWAGTPASARGYWRNTASRLFKEHRKLEAIVIGGGPSYVGLRREYRGLGNYDRGRSPILFIRRGLGGTRYRVIVK
jgi:uncharacterized protein (TIGR02996 family)